MLKIVKYRTDSLRIYDDLPPQLRDFCKDWPFQPTKIWRLWKRLGTKGCVDHLNYVIEEYNKLPIEERDKIFLSSLSNKD